MLKPSATAFSASRFTTVILTPEHVSPLNTDDDGVNRTGVKRTPGIPRAFRVEATRVPSIHGAPNCSNGVSVPRPTETFVVSRRPTPG